MNFFERLFGRRSTPTPKKAPTSEPAPQPAPAVAPVTPSAASIAAPAPLPKFPYPLQAAPGAVAVKQWRTLQAEWRKEGCSALLVGDAKEAQRVGENFSFSENPVANVLENAKSQKPFRFFREQLKGMREYLDPEDGYDPWRAGDWPTEPVEAMELGAHRDVLSRRPKETVYFAKIPTVHAFEIPAYLRFGNWNACPSPEEHVTILRRWSERYGLEMYALTGDVVECEIARPPASCKEALKLAREQYLYCNDIVDQGVGSISGLAAILECSNHWYFWWD